MKIVAILQLLYESIREGISSKLKLITETLVVIDLSVLIYHSFMKG